MPLHDVAAALPSNDNADKGLLRGLLIRRMPYVLTDAESSTDLTAVDPDTGAAILDILYLGRVFHFDDTDHVTANDGVTCLVSSDGLRYKLASGTDVFAYSVINVTTTVPPVSPTIGDAYLVAVAATGDWSGKDGYVSVFTQRGWEFVNFGIGRFVYSESNDTYYHKNVTNSWVAGFGSQVIGTNSVPLSAAINFGNRVVVENQTTNSPPASPIIGVAYIIGPIPTGDWTGNALKIAICEDGVGYSIYNPSNGWLAFDKSQNQELLFNGAAWISGAGSWVARKSVATASGSTTAATGTTGYSYSSGTAPTTGQRRLIDTATIFHTAKRASAVLRFDYAADAVFAVAPAATFTATTGPLVIALFRDSVSDAIAWHSISLLREFQAVITASGATVTSISYGIQSFFEITAPDTSSHTYKIAIMSSGDFSSPIDATDLTRRLFTIQEAA